MNLDPKNQNPMTNTSSDIRFAFFGHDVFSTGVLDALVHNGFTPDLIVTGIDKPVGRKRTLTPPPAKEWAEQNTCELIQTEKLDASFIDHMAHTGPWDVFIVASYGHILPHELISLPAHGTLNVHPSFLPRLRGADPIRHALLHETTTGVSIMQIDEKMDHGPLLAQAPAECPTWPLPYPEARDCLATQGGNLLAQVLPEYLNGNLVPTPQDHEQATFTHKTTRTDGEVALSDNPETLWRKYCAYTPWPGTFFYTTRNGENVRVKITHAIYENNTFTIERVVPEGKKEMSYDDFLRGAKS